MRPMNPLLRTRVAWQLPEVTCRHRHEGGAVGLIYNKKEWIKVNEL